DGLPQIFAMESRLPVKQAEDKEQLQPGTIYVAPPAYHLLIETQRAFALSVDPPIKYSRPSIDVLFESARDAYGPEIIAVLLSAPSDDGAAGMHEIHAAGGVTIVQEPESSEVSTMPRAALERFTPTYVWPAAKLAAELPKLLEGAHVAEQR